MFSGASSRTATDSQPTGRRLFGARAAVALALLAVPLAGACGRSSHPSPAERPLRIGLYGAPSLLDPHLQSEAAAQTVLGNVFQALVAFDPDMRVVPSLAATWENPDDLTWRFHLRPGVTFHDGTPLAATTVVASVERARLHPDSRVAGFLVAIESCEALDDATVEVRTRTPYPILLNKMAFVAMVPEGSPRVIEAPVGTGPYRLLRHDPGRRVALAAYPGYWGESPSEPEVEYLFLPEAAERVRLLLDGEVDLVYDVPAEDAETVEVDPATRLAASSSLEVVYLQLVTDRPPFDDPRVRRAIDLAVDRAALVREVLRGHGMPAGQLVPPNVFGFSPDLLPVERDLDLARRLLAEAGHAGGLDLELEHREGRDAGAIVRQLGEAGIRVRTVARPWGEMYARLVAGEVGFYLGAWISTSGDASDLLDQKAHTADPARGYGTANANAYSNPALDLLIEKSGSTLNMIERRTILQRALAVLGEDRALLPLYAPFELYGLREGVHFRPRLDGRLPASEVRR